MPGVLVVVDVAVVVRVVEDLFGIEVLSLVCVVLVEAVVVDKEARGVGAKGVLVAIVSVGCVSEKHWDSVPPASKQKVASGSLSGLE